MATRIGRLCSQRIGNYPHSRAVFALVYQDAPVARRRTRAPVAKGASLGGRFRLLGTYPQASSRTLLMDHGTIRSDIAAVTWMQNRSLAHGLECRSPLGR